MLAALLAAVVAASVLATTTFVTPALAAVGNPVVTLGPAPDGNGVVVNTGTEIFDGLGECGSAAPAAPPVPYPGNDCSAADNVVRTNDLVAYGYSVGVTNLDGPGDPGGPEFVDDTYFTQTITPTTADAFIGFASLPVACRDGANPDTGNAYDPQSSITINPDGSTTLVCNVGRLSGPSQTIFMQTLVKVSSDSKNGSSFSSTDTICSGAGTGGCTPVSSRVDVTGTDLADSSGDHLTYISASPRFDLAKNKYGPNDSGVVTNPANGELGFLYRFYPTIEVDAAADGKGSSPLDGDITFSDMMYVQGTTTQVPQFLMHPTSTNDCRANNHSSRPIPYGYESASWNDNRAVIDTGTVSCTQSAPGDPIEFTLSGTDTSGDRFPEFGANGSTSLQPPYYVAVLYNYIWVPFDVVDRYDPAAICDAADAAAGFGAPFCGAIDGVGDLPVTNCLEGFDPNALDAAGNPVSNYGAGIEPGIYGAGDGNNNCRNTSFRLRNRGSVSKYFHEEVVDGGWVGGVLPGQTAYHSGDGPIEPNQFYATATRLGNSGSAPFDDAVLCEKVDNMTATLVPIQRTGAWVPTDGLGRVMPAEAAVIRQTVAASDIIVEYASGPAGTPANGEVSWDTDHLVGGINALSGLYDQSVATNQAATNCSDAEGNWTTDPYSFDTDEATSLGMIRSVRMRLTSGITLDPGSDLRLSIELQQRNTFYGGPHDGELIPAGVIVPNFMSYRADQLNSGNFVSSNYNQNTDSSSRGDRVLTSRGFVRVAKHVVPYNTPWASVDPADYQATDNGMAGDPFQFRLLPAVRSNLASGAASLTNVTVVDTLPEWLTFDPVCTANVSAYGAPAVANNTPSAGETTLTWSLGAVVPNGTLDPIDFCVVSNELAPDGTSAVNRVEISATEDVSTLSQRSATATILLNQIGEFRVLKAVDSPLDPLDNNQIYTIEWLNSSDFVTLDPNIAIDVFPHNLDEAGEGGLAPRNPGSDFTGTLELVGEPISTAPGDFFYTKRTASEVNYSPTASSNPFDAAPFDTTNTNLGTQSDTDDDGEADSGRTIWCEEADFGATGCPASFAEATGMMFVGSADIDPGESDSIAIELQADGNNPNELYANRYATFTPSLPGQLNESNTVLVRTAALTLGDLVWFDTNNNGIYEPGRGEVGVPDGVVVQLLDASLNLTGLTTTTVDGRYLFDGLAPGNYAVQIPASEFAAGGALAGYAASSAAGDANDPNNDSVDQNGTNGPGGVVITDLVTLSFTTVGPDASGNIDIFGDEPLGDDVAGIATNSDDALNNLTLDIGLTGTPGITIVKSVDGDDANTTPGAAVAIGTTVDWTYLVTNSGDIDLTNVVVTDDQGEIVTCPAHLGDPGGDNVIDELLQGESVTCTASGTSTAGQYTNVGSVTGVPGAGTPVSDNDPANHFGVDASIDIETLTNGVQADTGPGPQVVSGAEVTWTYVVTNTGNAALANVVVNDDQLIDADISCATHMGDADGDHIIDVLLPGQSVTCTATGRAVPGQYANVGDVSGNPVFPTAPGAGFDPADNATYPTASADFSDVAGLTDVVDTDPTHHNAIGASIDIEKLVNGDDADTAPGINIDNGTTATWTFVVTNTGNAPLTSVTVSDDDASVAVDCGDGTNVIALLAPGASQNCTGSAEVVAGAYVNIGSVSGQPSFPTNATSDPAFDPDNPATWSSDPADYAPIIDPTTGAATAPVTDDDPAHHFGNGPAISLTEEVCLLDDQAACDPANDDHWGKERVHLPEDTEEWRYTITNTGNVDLVNVEFVEPGLTNCSTTIGDLAVGETVVITCSGQGPDVPFATVSTVTGESGTGVVVQDDDVASLLPPPELQIVKSVVDDTITNGQDVTYLLTVTNVGEGVATGVVMTDPLPAGLTFRSAVTQVGTTSFTNGTLQWNIGTLQPGASVALTFTATISSTATTITNVATVVGEELEPLATQVDNTDDAVVQVLAATPVTNTTPLASTGSNTGMLVGVSLILLSAGAGLILLAGRRRTAA